MLSKFTVALAIAAGVQAGDRSDYRRPSKGSYSKSGYRAEKSYYIPWSQRSTQHPRDIRVFNVKPVDKFWKGFKEAQEDIVATCTFDYIGQSWSSGSLTLVQNAYDLTFISGHFEGAVPGEQAMKIHEFGDLSGGCVKGGTIGDIYNPFGTEGGESHYDINKRRVGDLEHMKGRIMNDNTADFVSRDPVVQLSGPNSVIGRTIALYEGEDGSFLVELPATAVHPALEKEDPGEIVACCVIGLANPKKQSHKFW